MENQNEEGLIIFKNPDGTTKEGYIEDIDNNTIIIRCNDGSVECLAG
jgi:hypothetical protein